MSASAMVPAGAAPYVPDLVRDWPPEAPPVRRVEGTLVSADISGFTALSERLAAHGREGAEELTDLLNRCFGGMIEIIDANGGDVLKFGGDALLTLFEGPGHVERAAAACWDMRRLIERRWATTLVRRVELGISQGIHAGTFELHLVEAGHRELLVVGPGMSTTVTCEAAADRGEILLSHAAARSLPDDLLGAPSGAGRPLVARTTISVESTTTAPTRCNGSIEAYLPGWLLEQAAAGKIAEHRVVTVGFVCFGGVDQLVASDGDGEVHRRLQALATATEEAASRHGVHWLASDVYPDGGKIILTAGAPRSTGQDEDAAVRTIEQILAADVGLQLRAGVHRGPVFMGDLGSDRRCTFTVMGDAVNLAARLMQKSDSGQLVASQDLLERVPTTFRLDPLEPFAVKGKSAPIRASLVGARTDVTDGGAVPGTAAGTDTVPQLAFVGRRHELATLRAELEAARQGSGRTVAVLGEPGIGKSRLVDELLHGTDHPVLRAKGGLYSRRTPYFATSLMLRRLAGIEEAASPARAGEQLTAWIRRAAPDQLPRLPLLAIAANAEVQMTEEVERVDPANRAARLRDTIVDVIAAVTSGPVVFVIDDAHRLDEATEEVFATIAGRIAGHPWLMLALHPDDPSAFTDRVELSARIEVGPLTAEESLALTTEAVATDGRYDADALDDLARRGVTNPLFVLELVRAGIGKEAETPASIEAVVTARIDTLNAADRLLLREAAVLGSVVDADLLAAAIGDVRLRTEARWDGLSSFLVRDSATALRFQHGLYREVAYQGLSYRRRRQIHAEVGMELERRAGDDPGASSELLSLHFHEARDWPRSWRYSVAAGERARSKYAHAEAVEFYARALQVPARWRPGHDAVSAVAESMADSCELDAQFDRADEALTTARRFCHDPASDVRLVRKKGVIRERQGHYTNALRWYGRGLTACERLPGARASSAECELCLAYAGVRFRQGELHETTRWAHRAERLARRLDDQRLLAHSAYLLLIGYALLRRPEAAAYSEVPLRLYEQLGDLVGQANVLNNLGTIAKDEGRWYEALQFYERSRDARRQSGDVIGAATADLNIAEVLSDQGHLDDAEQLYEEALRAWRRARYEAGIAVVTSYLGRVQARRGDIDRARELLVDALQRFTSIGASHFVLETRVIQLECEVLAGRGAEVVEDARALLATASEVGDPLLEVMVLRAEGWALMEAGRHADAERLADRCLQLADSVGAVYEVALGLILRGRALEAQGGDRRPDHRRARRLLEQLGVVSLPRIQRIGADDAANEGE